MSRGMTISELGTLLEHVKAEHSFCQPKNGRSVKYIDPIIDNRTGLCYSITFRRGNDSKCFHITNECRDLPDSLFQRCMNWLDESIAN